MKKLLYFLLVNCQLLFAQNTVVNDTFTGVVEHNYVYHHYDENLHNVIATFTVVKTVKNDSVIFNYLLFHDNDTTRTVVKYAINMCCEIVNYNGDSYTVSDSLVINGEHIYVYDFNYPDKDEIEGFFCMSQTLGVISVGDFNRAECFKFDGYPRFDTRIESYRKQRAANK